MGSRRRHIPDFALYGESGNSDGSALALHVEEIQTRSRKYRWEIAPHTHGALAQCLFIVSGPAHVRLDTEEIPVAGPVLVISPPRTVHSFRFDEQTRGFVLTLPSGARTVSGREELDTVPGWLFAAPRLMQLEVQCELPARLSELFSLLLREFRRPDSAQAPVCQHLARAVLWLIEREARHRVGIDRTGPPLLHRQHAFERFRALLEQHYQQHWTVARYAHALRTTATRLTRLCRSLSGATAFELIRNRVLTEAQRRLVYTTLSVNQIAEELGFADPAYFCRFFRRRTGESPQRFRMSLVRRGGTPSFMTE